MPLLPPPPTPPPKVNVGASNELVPEVPLVVDASVVLDDIPSVVPDVFAPPNEEAPVNENPNVLVDPPVAEDVDGKSPH